MAEIENGTQDTADRKTEMESVRRNAFSLALWDGATDEQAHAKADLIVRERFPEVEERA